MPRICRTVASFIDNGQSTLLRTDREVYSTFQCIGLQPIMTPPDFKHSLTRSEPPDGLLPALVALWWAGKDDWNKAHLIVANGEGSDCAWVHAHLHRVEGDLDNAAYWYRQARRQPATGDLATERATIAATLLASSTPDRPSRPPLA